MNITSRSYLTAGIAALGAGAIALTPVQPIPNHVAMAPERAVSTLAVDLAAAIDPITPWVTALSAAADNAYALQETWSAKPFPILQTIVENQFTYLSELPNIGLIFQQITGNIGNALRAPFATGAENVSNITVPGSSPGPIPVVLPNGITQRFVYDTLTGLAPDLEPVLSLLTSPLSGFLLGFAGPGLSSMLQLQESIQAIFNPPEGAKPVLNAINEIINLPANLFNASFNGGKFLDLTDLVKNLVGPTIAPAISSAGVRTGGFLNAGGVAFDGLSANATLGFTVVDPGLSVGFIGATGTLANYVADAIKVTPPAPTASVAAAAATPAVEAATPVADDIAQVTPAAVAADAIPAAVADAADTAPAPKRQSRAARGDGAGSGENASRAGRATRSER